MASICYHDFIKDVNPAQEISRVTLIEPSEMALSRASLLCSHFYPNAEIVTVNKDFENLSEKDIELEQFNQQMIEEAALENSKAGTYVSEGVKLASVTYDVEDRAMVFEYQTTNLIADALSQSSPKEHKDEMINEMKSEKQFSVVKIAMEEYDFKYKYIFKKKNGNTVRSITISWSDFQ